MLFGFDPFKDFDRSSAEVWEALSRRSTLMPLDAYRRGDVFVVHVDLPGIDPTKVDLTVDHNVLTIRAERDWTPQEGDRILANERPRGAFSRQLMLGDTLDARRIAAHYDQGVLTVTIPVAETAKPRKVQVSVGDSPTAVDAASTPAGLGEHQEDRPTASVG